MRIFYVSDNVRLNNMVILPNIVVSFLVMIYIISLHFYILLYMALW